MVFVNLVLRFLLVLIFENECQYPYEKNNIAKFLNWDIAKTEAADVAALSEVNLKRIEASVAGGTWRDYPEDYVFFDENKPLSYASVGRMIGNSVPVRLGEVIGESIQKHVKAMV